MKRKAFTLVELLVVIAVIGILLTISMPSLGRARALTRAAVCERNLSQIGTAFLAGTRHTAYPAKQQWPMIPYDSIKQMEIFRCPDDPGGGIMDMFPGLKYELHSSGYGDIVIPFENCLGCISRTGTDSKGQYIEFVFEESPGVQVQWCSCGGRDYPNCHGHDDKDGVFRFHTDEQGAVTMTLMNYFDNSATYISLFGEKLWPKNSGESLHNYVGQTENLSLLMSSYGINSNVCNRQQVRPGAVVLLDYDQQVADMDFPNVIAKHLVEPAVARHLGRLNVLMSDQSVVRLGPTELNPKINPARWLP